MRGKIYVTLILIFMCGCSKTRTYKTAVVGIGKAEPEIRESIKTNKEVVRKLTEKLKARCVRVINVHEVVFDILGEKRSGGLLGIRGPTPDDPRISVRKMGEEALKILKEKIEKKDIYIEFDHGETHKHTNWRVYVYLPNGDFINADLVLEGYARVRKRIGHFKYKKDLLKMEEYARAHKHGFWEKVAEVRKNKNKK